ncbi:hypothetical protein WJX73_004661 [Symbiochloris irregularis]|uniref:BHLH domain-containing protein n=1 Tax=Symbiochloris irregularis TaxID=706552 RepID=A0AAW1NRS1_9CHLO
MVDRLSDSMPPEFDYTFTEDELKNILGYMESHQQTNEPRPEFGTVPFVGQGSSVPLQFQPHTADSLGQQTPSHSGDSQSFEDGGVAVKQEPVVDHLGLPRSSHEAASVLPHLNGFFPPTQPAAVGPPPSQIHKTSPLSVPTDAAPLETRSPSTTGTSTYHASYAGNHKKDAHKGHISHSTVEKQRRDRINALIDELRDMVPPQSANSAAQDGTDSKRPKHVVLSDTIQLIRDLQDKARLSSSPQPGDKGQGASELFRRTYSDRNISEAGRPPSSPPELPLAPEGALPSSGVVVEQGEGCLYVKVNCKDRRGLLSDIITSLKAIPLEITTAAVTTTGNGYVHDVFQVKVDPTSACSAQDIQCHVHATMYNLTESHLGDKRRRTRG